MKRRFLLSVLFIICLGLGVGIASELFGVTEALLARGVAAREKIAVPPVSEEIEAPASLNAPATPAASPSPLEMLEEWNTKALASLPTGWVHIRQTVSYDTDTGNNGTFSEGVTIPNAQINDAWYQLGQGGVVLAVVNIMRTIDGQIVQVGVASDGTNWNSVTDEVDQAELFPIRLDGGVYYDIQWLQGLGLAPQVSKLILEDGTHAVQFCVIEKYNLPTQMTDYEKLVTAIETRAVFEEETGHFISKEVIVRFEDGTERVYERITQEVLVESPDAEVLSFLAEKEEAVK